MRLLLIVALALLPLSARADNKAFGFDTTPAKATDPAGNLNFAQPVNFPVNQFATEGVVRNFGNSANKIPILDGTGKLVVGIIPGLPASIITSGTFPDVRIASAGTWNAKENALTFSSPLSRTGDTISISTAGFEVPLTFSGGVTRASNNVTVDAVQNITRLSNLTTNGLVRTSGGNGTLGVDTATYLTGNQTITISGDVSGSGATTITATLGTVNSNVGTFGDLTHVPQFTVNGKGLITAASQITLTNASVGLGSVTNNAQTFAAIVPNTAPAAGQILVGNAGGTAYAPASVSGSGATISLSNAGVFTISAIPNASLSNSSITIAGTGTALGGSISRDTITGLSGNGVIARTAANTLIPRTLTGTANQISISNGDGVSGNPTLSIPASAQLSIANLTNLTTNGFVKTSGSTGALSIDTNAYLTGNQTITLSGDISGSGATAITTTIGANKVTLGMMATVATQTFLGRTTAATGNVEALTIAQAKALLNLTGTNSGDQTITLTGDITGSGTGSFATTLPNIVTAGTNAKITYNAKGQITAGTSLAAGDIPSTLNATTFSNSSGNTIIANHGIGATGTGTDTGFTWNTIRAYLDATTGALVFSSGAGLNIGGTANLGSGNLAIGPTAGTGTLPSTRLLILGNSGTATQRLLSIRSGNTQSYGFDWMLDDLTTGDLSLERVLAGSSANVMTVSRATGNVTFANNLAVSGTFLPADYDVGVSASYSANVVLLGDSLHQQLGGINSYYGTGSIPALGSYNGIAVSPAQGQNVAVAGTTVQYWRDNIGLLNATYRREAGMNIAVPLIGTNTLTSKTAAQTYSEIEALCRHLKATGWRVVLVGLLSRGGSNGNGSYDSQVGVVNAFLRQNWAQFADRFIDWGVINGGSNPFNTGGYSNTTYYTGDQLHQQVAGAQALAGYEVAVINDLLTYYFQSQRNQLYIHVNKATHTNVYAEGMLTLNNENPSAGQNEINFAFNKVLKANIRADYQGVLNFGATGYMADYIGSTGPDVYGTNGSNGPPLIFYRDTNQVTSNRPFRVSSNSASAGFSGSGLDFNYNASLDYGFITSFNYTTPAWKPLFIQASLIKMAPSGTANAQFDGSTGIRLFVANNTIDMSGVSGNAVIIGGTGGTFINNTANNKTQLSIYDGAGAEFGSYGHTAGLGNVFFTGVEPTLRFYNDNGATYTGEAAQIASVGVGGSGGWGAHQIDIRTHRDNNSTLYTTARFAGAGGLSLFVNAGTPTTALTLRNEDSSGNGAAIDFFSGYSGGKVVSRIFGNASTSTGGDIHFQVLRSSVMTEAMFIGPSGGMSVGGDFDGGLGNLVVVAPDEGGFSIVQNNSTSYGFTFGLDNVVNGNLHIYRVVAGTPSITMTLNRSVGGVGIGSADNTGGNGELMLANMSAKGGVLWFGNDGTRYLQWYDDGTTRVYNFSGAGVYANGAALTSSRNAKHNIQAWGRDFDVMALRPSLFDYNENPQIHPLLGFLADEVKTVLPEAVLPAPPGPNGEAREAIDPMAMIAALTRKVQQQETRIRELEHKNEKQPDYDYNGPLPVSYSNQLLANPASKSGNNANPMFGH